MTESPPVLTCAMCHDKDLRLDDVAVMGEHGVLACLRCWNEAVGSGKAMPKELQRQVIAAVNAPE